MKQRLTLNQLKKKLQPLLIGSKIKKAALFGSFARNEAIAGSDLDLLVDVQGGTTLFDLADIQISLEDGLKMKVDLVTRGALRPSFRKKVQAESIPVYERKKS